MTPRSAVVLALGLALLSSSPARAFPPPIPLAERIKSAQVVLHVELKRTVVLDDRNEKVVRMAAHVVVLEVLKGRFTEKRPTIEMFVVPSSEEGELIREPTPGQYLVLLDRTKDGRLGLWSPNVYAWMKATPDKLREAKLHSMQ